MDITIIPKKLKGTICIPKSKSYMHRYFIALFLSKNFNYLMTLRKDNFSKDIISTYDSLLSLQNTSTNHIPILNCNDSGSTLRFLIPISQCLGYDTVTFKRSTQLKNRPISSLIDIMSSKGCSFIFHNNSNDFSIKGQLQSGEFKINGDISSQYLSGLLMALPLLNGNSTIKLTTPLYSKGYVDITLDVLKTFNINIDFTEDFDQFHIKGNQQYVIPPFNNRFHTIFDFIERDWSQGSFWHVANALNNTLTIKGLNEDSIQPDKQILEIIKNLKYLNNFNKLDCSQIPDLVPILSILVSQLSKEPFTLYRIARLNYKESNRIKSTASMLNNLGISTHFIYQSNNEIDGIKIIPATIKGGTVDSFQDHRIIMATAIASTVSTSNITIKEAEFIDKSYPTFWREFISLKGQIKHNG